MSKKGLSRDELEAPRRINKKIRDGLLNYHNHINSSDKDHVSIFDIDFDSGNVITEPSFKIKFKVGEQRFFESGNFWDSFVGQNNNWFCYRVYRVRPLVFDMDTISIRYQGSDFVAGLSKDGKLATFEGDKVKKVEKFNFVDYQLMFNRSIKNVLQIENIIQLNEIDRGHFESVLLSMVNTVFSPIPEISEVWRGDLDKSILKTFL